MKIRIMAILVALGLLLNACGSGSSSDTTTTTSGGGTTTTTNSSSTTTTTGGGTTTTTTSTTTTTFDHSNPSWAISTLHSSGASGRFCSMGIDSNDIVHIAHYGTGTPQGLLYTTNISGTWETSVIENVSIAEGISLAVDNSDGLHISYYDTTGAGYNLKYASKEAGGTWATEDVDTAGSVGAFNAIAVDSNDKAHIVYRDLTNTALKYATNSSGSWQTEIVDSSASPSDTSICLNSSNEVYVAYALSNIVKYVTGTYGSWSTPDTIDSGTTMRNPSIALDSSSNVNISYFEYSGPSLMYATNSSGAWVASEVPNAYIFTGGGYTSIGIDRYDNIFIGYYKESGSSSGVKTAFKIGTGDWSIHTVEEDSDEDEDGEYTSLALDSIGRVHLCWQLGNGSNLKYAVEE